MPNSISRKQFINDISLIILKCTILSGRAISCIFPPHNQSLPILVIRTTTSPIYHHVVRVHIDNLTPLSQVPNFLWAIWYLRSFDYSNCSPQVKRSIPKVSPHHIHMSFDAVQWTYPKPLPALILTILQSPVRVLKVWSTFSSLRIKHICSAENRLDYWVAFCTS